jgi:hypothetical protein
MFQLKCRPIDTYKRLKVSKKFQTLLGTRTLSEFVRRSEQDRYLSIEKHRGAFGFTRCILLSSPNNLILCSQNYFIFRNCKNVTEYCCCYYSLLSCLFDEMVRSVLKLSVTHNPKFQPVEICMSLLTFDNISHIICKYAHCLQI